MCGESWEMPRRYLALFVKLLIHSLLTLNMWKIRIFDLPILDHS